MQGLLSLGRVFVLITASGIARADTWWFLSVTIACTSVLALLQVLGSEIARMPLATFTPAELVALVPQAAVVLLPIVVACGFGFHKAAVPRVLAAGIMVFVVATVCTGWLVPNSNQFFRETVSQRLSQDASIYRGLPELRPLDLVERVRSPYTAESLAALFVMVQRIGLAVSVPAFLVFGLAFRRRLFVRPAWWVAQLTSGLVATALMAGAVWLAFVVRTSWVDGWFPRMPMASGVLGIWLSAALALVLATVLSSRTQDSERRNFGTPN